MHENIPEKQRANAVLIKRRKEMVQNLFTCKIGWIIRFYELKLKKSSAARKRATRLHQIGKSGIHFIAE